MFSYYRHTLGMMINRDAKKLVRIVEHCIDTVKKEKEKKKTKHSIDYSYTENG